MSHTRLIAAVVTASFLSAPADLPAQSRRDRSDRDSARADDGVERTPPGTRPADGAAPSTQSRPAAMEDEFKILLDRSIFARSGTAAAVSRGPATTSTAPSTPQLTPEQNVLFVGVLAEDDEYIAFAENQTTRQLMVLRTGDDVARGKVVAITLDTIAYGSGGAIKEVRLGQNLAGEAVTSSFTSAAAPAGATTGAGTPAAPSTAGMTPEQAAVMERLRQRRQRGE